MESKRKGAKRRPDTIVIRCFDSLDNLRNIVLKLTFHKLSTEVLHVHRKKRRDCRPQRCLSSGRKDILLIVSSSATSWLLDHVIHNKGGLYHRLNHSLHLTSFSLKECKEYSDRLNLGFTKSQILELYMAFGGIPNYWSLLKRGDSVSQNIDRLCFA